MSFSIKNKDIRGSMSLPSSNNGFSHTAWYVAGSGGLLQKLRGGKDINNVQNSSLMASSTTNAYDLHDSNNEDGNNKKKMDKAKSFTVNNNNSSSSLSQVYAISSRGPRDDIDNLQIRATIRAVIAQS